jgi:hypothetical protein
MLFLSGHLHADKTQVAHPSRTQANKMQSNHLPEHIHTNMHTNYPSKHIHFLKKVTELVFIAHIHTNVQSSLS